MIEQIKKDREEGTPGKWDFEGGANSYFFAGRIIAGDKCVAFVEADEIEVEGDDNTFTPSVDASRIARIPELEEYVLEAHELLKEVLAGACVNYAYIAPRNIERIKKLVGEE